MLELFSPEAINKMEMDSACSKCGLEDQAHTPNMPIAGQGKKGILFLFDHPDSRMDRRGSRFTGYGYDMLENLCRPLGLNLKRDCWLYSSINCFSNRKRTNIDKHMACCRHKVQGIIQQVKPKVVIPLGMPSFRSLIKDRWTKNFVKIERWRGFQIPTVLNDHWYRICPTYNPIFVSKEEKNPMIRFFFQKDVLAAIRSHSKPIPAIQPHQYIDRVELLNIRDAEKILKQFTAESKPTAFDYETTGLKPDKPKHRVICMSVCRSPDKAYAFPVKPNLVPAIRAFLRSPCKKIAANLKYEESWSRVYFKCRVRNWWKDVVLSGHIVDNRPAVSSVKFQALVLFGVGGYDSYVRPYLESQESDANAFNRIEEIEGTADLLTYCGMDSLLEFLIAEEHDHVLSSH